MRALLRGERGAYAVLFAIITVAMFTMVAIVVDLGSDRSAVRTNRNYADLAALAGVGFLPNAFDACRASWRYLILNGAVPSGTSDPCAPYQGMECDNSTAPVSTTPVTVGSTVIKFTFPVSDAQLAALSTTALGTASRTSDRTQCERMGIDIRSAVTSLFSGILGRASLSAPATAVVVKSPGSIRSPVALLLLEPHGCGVLNANGSGATIHVHASPGFPPGGPPFTTNPSGGRITSDSDGKPVSGDNSCNGANSAIITTSSSSTPNVIETFNTFDQLDPTPQGPQPGIIEVYSIQPPDVTCTASNKACLTSQIDPPNSFGIINAQKVDGSYGVPQSLFSRITRAPFDDAYNCQATYPDYLGLPEVPVLANPDDGCNTSTRSPYINNLVTAIDGSSTTPTGTPPGTWNVVQGAACSISSGTVTFTGNTYVNCDPFSVSGGTVNFAGGNVVFQGSVQVTGGTLNLNSDTTLPATSGWSGCLTQVTGCTNQWSPDATFVYMRPGGSKVNTCGGVKNTTFCVAGTGTTFNMTNTFLFLRDPTVFPYNESGVNDGSCGSYPNIIADKCTGDDGQFTIKAGSSNATMTAPKAGPFKNLAIWSDSSLDQTIGAQGTLSMRGVFFFPTANVNYSGQACTTPTDSQFVARTLNVSGTNACLNMTPTPGGTVLIPIFGPLLIR